jgi:hypothetical protein
MNLNEILIQAYQDKEQFEKRGFIFKRENISFSEGSISFQGKHYPKEKETLDITTQINFIFSLTWEEKENFIKEFNQLIEKYRI